VQVRVLDISGVMIGDGTLRLYAPDRINYLQTAHIELELRMDNRYITPTPAGPINITPVPHTTSTPLPGRPIPSPHVSMYEESGQTIYARMGASLRCLPSSFEGCDEGYHSEDLRNMGVSGTTWVWNIRPQSDLSGLQDLNVEVWTLEIVQDQNSFTPRWQHTFQIEVSRDLITASSAKEKESGVNALVLISIVVVVGTVLSGGVLTIWSMHRLHHPKIFISYQRKTGFSTAQNVCDRLEIMGADVFLDVDDIHEGHFERIIEKEIILRPHFVVVLAPGTLDSKWVCREIATAIRHDKNIVPLLIGGFHFEGVMLPDEIKLLSGFNAIKVEPEFFGAAMDKLAVFVKLKAPK